MTTDAQKSALLTDLDATPRVRETTGRGSAGALVVVHATITPANGGANSTYSLFRVPSNAKIKKIQFASASQGTTGIFEIGAWYATDGSNSASLASHIHSGADAISEGFFGSSLSAASQAVWAELVPGGGWSIENATPAILTNANWTLALGATGNEELWSVLGLATDPKCNIDIVAENTTALATPVAFWSRLEYVL